MNINIAFKPVIVKVFVTQAVKIQTGE